VLSACVFWLVRDLDLARLWTVLRSADPALVVLAALANLALCGWARLERWRFLLRAIQPARPLPPRAQLWSVLVSSGAASNLLPAKAGEVLRVLHLSTRHGYDSADLVTVQIVEKLVDVLSLMLLSLPVLLFAAPQPALRALAIIAGGGALGFAVLFLLARRTRQLPEAVAGVRGLRRLALAFRAFIARIANAARRLHAARTWGGALGFTLAADLADVLMIGLCLHAVGLSLDPGAWIVVFISINAALALPATPGNAGILEVGAVLGLAAGGVAHGESLGFALLYHAAQVVPTTAIGLISLRLRWGAR
jgi:uncharacterized protein (TIRG00374 family)